MPTRVSLQRWPALRNAGSWTLCPLQPSYLDNDEVIEFVHSVFRGDKYTLHTRL